jgi:DNA-binding SARP family transcriptional activator
MAREGSVKDRRRPSKLGSMLRVRMFGGLALSLDDDPVELPASPRLRALIAWLALHPGPQPRSRVAGVFWPDVLERSARGSLRAALTALRDALGPAASHLVATRDTVALDDVWVDVRELDQLLTRGELERATQLAVGDLLPKLDDDWVDELREHYRARLAQAHAQLARGGALEHARAWALLDPLSEDAARTLIEQLAAAGDRAAALVAYNDFDERLRTRLGVVPSAATRALADSLRRGEPPAPAADDILPAALVAGSGGRFVGRTAELERLEADLAAAQRGECRLALVVGEPGSGKTRLAAEFARRAHARGALVRYGRATEEVLVPYQPFVEALALSVDEHADNRYRLFESVRQQLTRWADARTVVLVIDDVQWIDDASALLLRHLAVAHDPVPVLLLATCSDEQLGHEHALTRLVADVRRERTVDRIELGGLVEAEIAQLEGAAERAAELCSAAGGNPFFVEQLVRDGQAVPQGARDVIASRLGRLSPAARELLALAAVVGSDFSLDVLARAGAVDEARLLAPLDEALRAQLIREDPQVAGAYRWAHALVREAVYSELSAARRARMHGRIVEALEQLAGPPTEQRLDRLAYHCARAGALGTAEKTVAYSRDAGDRAAAKLAFEAAAVHYECALHSLSLAGNDPATRAELEAALAEVRARAGDAVVSA